MNERLVCLDIGDVRIGVAVSDLTRTIATPVEVITRVGFGPDVKKIAAVCERYGTREILSGLPLNMDGTEGFQAQKVKLLCEQLEKAGYIVYYQDERLTTVTAESALLEGGMHREDRKRNVDKVAAAVILQQYLDTMNTARTAQHEEEQTMADNNEEFFDYEDEPNIIELEDETGEVVTFEFLMPIEYNGDQYMTLMPVTEDSEDEEEAEVVIMKIDADEEGNECYIPVEDEDTQAAIFELFLQAMEDSEEE